MVKAVQGEVLERVMAEYTSAWVVVRSFIPWSVKLSGTVVSTTSRMFLVAPSLARWSTSLFLWFPEWPLTHLKYVGATRLRSWYAATWNHCLLEMFVHPLSSQEARCLVRLSRAYIHISSQLHRLGVTVGLLAGVLQLLL